MKNLILLILLFFISLTGLKAGEFTGAGAAVQRLLQYHRMDVREIQAQGLKIGEVTGTGKRVFTENVVQFVTPKEVISNSRISHIEFKASGRARTVSDILSVEYRGKKIKAQNLKVIIYQR